MSPLPRILVVEDETRIFDFLARGLSADGMTVDGAGTGAQAVKRVLEQRTTSSSSTSSSRS